MATVAEVDEAGRFSATATSGGAIIARCVVCRIGFVITSETAETGRANMITHLDAVHGAGL